MEPTTIALAAITLIAATVNGALGYGFSSITVPVALFFLTNRVLNPALVPIEVVLNAYVLWVNRGSIQHVWRRTLPIVVALLPGVIVGTMLVSQVNSDWLKFITYVTLLPLILLQAAGFRRPIRSERSAGLAFGGALGVLYSVTPFPSASGGRVSNPWACQAGIPRGRSGSFAWPNRACGRRLRVRRLYSVTSSA